MRATPSLARWVALVTVGVAAATFTALASAEGALPRVTSAAPLADSDARDRIVEAIQRKYNARVVRVTESTVDGRRVYELRLLSDERVWMVRVDAETGRELTGKD
jgi:hypothetical protein